MTGDFYSRPISIAGDDDKEFTETEGHEEYALVVATNERGGVVL